MEQQCMERVAKGVVFVLHPLLMPVYGVAVLLFGDTVLRTVPLGLTLYYMGMVFLMIFAIPFFVINILNKYGSIKEALAGRVGRILPFIVVSICYLLCIYVISNTTLFFLVRKFLISCTGCVLILAVVNWFVCVDYAMVSAGAVTSALILIAISGFGNLSVPICIAFMLSGLLGSALLYLGKETPLREAAGYFGGMVVSALFMLF